MPTMRCPASSTLFPYTTLFRSRRPARRGLPGHHGQPGGLDAHAVLHERPRHQLGQRREVGYEKVREVRSEEHTSELQSPCISYAVLCLKEKMLVFRADVDRFDV